MLEEKDKPPVDDPPADRGYRDRVDVDKIVDKTVRKVYQESIALKYVECPGCGNLILRKYGECHKCKLRYDSATQSWSDVVEAAPEKDQADEGDDSPTLL